MREKTLTSRCQVALAITALCALGLSACGSNPTTTDTTTMKSSVGQSSAAPHSDTPTTETTDTPTTAADASMKTQAPKTPAQLVPTAVRLGTHEGYDRVVIELHGTGTPGWWVDYDEKPAQHGSGTPVEFLGDSALNVNIDGVSLPFEVGLEDPELAAAEGAGPVVRQVQSLGTFEGRAQFVIGINGAPKPYSVQVLENPSRVVIDIYNG
ncbi:hypothetical protein CMUST_02940 [Corynebacterium mustelae]|uniref:AMIN-like domain-containing protein n=1 Tax=Corynebacterium mustelae TaxID=571915 RepID=A0A0G3H1E4_9CORY|nr:hypothetical protein [Corynebacterium mustelae]AKK04932.1 hypothetical protein CMUST_02940 [Corynebacterium mustelae]